MPSFGRIGSESPIHAFYQFLGRRLDGGDADLTPEQSVREFRLYQEEVVRFLGETEAAAKTGGGKIRVQRTYGVPFGARDLLLSWRWMPIASVTRRGRR